MQSIKLTLSCPLENGIIDNQYSDPYSVPLRLAKLHVQIKEVIVMGDLLKRKVAVVTGSGQGIGRVIAIGLAKEGASVVTNNRRPGSTGFAILKEAELKALTDEQRVWVNQQLKEFSGDAETLLPPSVSRG